MNYFSLFSGIGGFEMGFPDDWHCVGHSEIDKYARAIYQYHFPGHRNYGDATRISTDELPDFDLLCAGFPCQSFSVAGRGGGLEDSRGTLFFEIVRILRDKRPGYFLLENVKGLLGHASGKTFQTILESLATCGYLVQWEILNSQHFGVPQNRERVFIIGHLRGQSGPEIFPLGDSNPASDEEKSGVYCIDANYGKGGAKGSRTMIAQWEPDNHQQDRVYDPCDIRCQLSAGTHGNAGHLLKIKDGLRIRRLTPVECERLQGFPDDFTKYGLDQDGNQIEISDTQRYKCLGNAVTVNVIKAITGRMKGWAHENH